MKVLEHTLKQFLILTCDFFKACWCFLSEKAERDEYLFNQVTKRNRNGNMNLTELRSHLICLKDNYFDNAESKQLEIRKLLIERSLETYWDLNKVS